MRMIFLMMSLSLTSQSGAEVTSGDHSPSQINQQTRVPSSGEPAAFTGNPDRVLLVFFSGFKSCDENKLFEELQLQTVASINQNQPQKKVDVIRFCYNGSKGSVRVTPPGSTKFLAEESTLRDTLLQLKERQKNYGDSIMIGHSWGGWSLLRAIEGMEKPKLTNPNQLERKSGSGFGEGLYDGWEKGAKDALAGSLETADPRSVKQIAKDEELEEEDREGGFWFGYAEGYEEAKKNQKIISVPPLSATLLITIDPISGKMTTGCNPGTLYAGRPACREFPKDIDQKLVVSRVKKGWMNFYQNDQKRLHSSPANASNSKASQKLSGNHSSLIQDRRLRKEVLEAIAKSLAPK